MTILDGGGFPPHESASGRRERHSPFHKLLIEPDKDEGDGIKPSAKYSTKSTIIVLLVSIIIAWLTWMFRVIEKESGSIPAVGAILFLLLCAYWIYRKVTPREEKPKPRK